MSNDAAATPNKQYAAPKLSQVPAEEAKALLLDQAAQGDNVAKDLLNLLSGLST